MEHINEDCNPLIQVSQDSMEDNELPEDDNDFENENIEPSGHTVTNEHSVQDEIDFEM